jgi:phosphate transport system protein
MSKPQHTVKSFEQELQDLILDIQNMKNLSIELIKLSQDSLVNYEKDNFLNAKEKDRIVNQLEREIEQKAISLLALRQPMASDLRVIVSTIKIISLLERIADRAKKTVKKTNHITQKFDKEVIEDIFKMNNLVIDMINNVFDNLEKYTFTKLKAAVDEDDKVDEFYSNTMRKIIAKQEKEPVELEEFIAKIKILKNFERIGDYATKIAKIINYIA